MISPLETASGAIFVQPVGELLRIFQPTHFEIWIFRKEIPGPMMISHIGKKCFARKTFQSWFLEQLRKLRKIFRSSEALPKFGREKNHKIKYRIKKLFFSNVWNYHSFQNFSTKIWYLKMPWLENSQKIFRNRRKSSEIFRNLPKSRFVADRVAQDRSN